MTFVVTVFPRACADCAVCENGYGPGYQFSCSSCVGQDGRSAIGEATKYGVAGRLESLTLHSQVILPNDRDFPFQRAASFLVSTKHIRYLALQKVNFSDP